MKSIVNTYISINCVKDISVQSRGQLPSIEDRCSLRDKIGNVVQIDVGIIFNAIVAIANSRGMTVDQYLSKLNHTIGENDAEKSEQ